MQHSMHYEWSFERLGTALQLGNDFLARKVVSDIIQQTKSKGRDLFILFPTLKKTDAYILLASWAFCIIIGVHYVRVTPSQSICFVRSLANRNAGRQLKFFLGESGFQEEKSLPFLTAVINLLCGSLHLLGWECFQWRILLRMPCRVNNATVYHGS